jgi:hypothetical protein
MNTKLLLASSAVVMLLAGVAGLFAPHELLVVNDVAPTGSLPLLVQLYAALLLGAAINNWTAKGSAIGGIYNKPLALGNLLHFATGGITLAKVLVAGRFTATLAIATAVYCLFAIGFGMVVFGRSPRAAGGVS